MKIVYLQDDFEPYAQGGSAIVVANIAKAMAKDGHKVCVITSVQQKSQAGSFFENGIQVERIHVPFYEERWRAYLSLYNLRAVIAVKAILTKFCPDIVHAHNIHRYLSYTCLKFAKQNGAKVFLTAHDVMLFHYGKLVEFIDPNDLSCHSTFNYKVSPWQQIKKYKKRYNPFRNFIIKHYLKYMDKIFAVSNALKDALNQNGIKNVEVIHNGIDVSKWKVSEKAVNDFKKKYNLQNKKIILFGGRLSGAKGGERMILAMQTIVKRIPESILLVLGKKDDYAESMMKLAKKLGIHKNIIFTGWLLGDELRASYNISNIVVVPSICFDSFPTINLEAMASGKPVVGTCFGGTPEIVVDGVTGYIVNPLNIEEIADKTVDLLKNSEKAENFGKAGYERVVVDFNLENMVKKHISIYEKFKI